MIALYILAGLVSLLLLIAVISFVLVGVGLFFKVDKGIRQFKDGTSTTQYDLPQWLLWLTNPEDGLTGDSSARYWSIYMKGRPAWWKMLVWSAWRNPFNYLKRFIWGIDIRKYLFSKVAAQHASVYLGHGEGFSGGARCTRYTNLTQRHRKLI